MLDRGWIDLKEMMLTELTLGLLSSVSSHPFLGKGDQFLGNFNQCVAICVDLNAAHRKEDVVLRTSYRAQQKRTSHKVSVIIL